MNILKFELKKLFLSKMLLFLLIFCFVLNFLVVYSQSYYAENLEAISDIVSKAGVEINENSLTKLQKLYDEELEKLRAFAPLAAQDMEESGGIDREHYVAGVRDYEYKLSIMELLINDGTEALQNDRMVTAGTLLLEKYASTDNKLLKLMYGVEAVLVFDNDFSAEYFAPSSAVDMHSKMLGNVICVLIIEMMFFAMFITVRSCTFEMAEGTHFLVYSAKRGRKIQIDKMTASLVTTAAVYGLLCIFTISVFFIMNDLKEFLFVPVSSTMYGSVFTTLDLNYSELICICLLTGLALSLIASALTYCVCGFIKNPFGAIGGFILLQAVCLLATNGMYSEDISLFDKLLTASPIGLIMNFSIENKVPQIVTSSLFCVTPNSIPLFEIFTVIVWILICLLCGKLSERVFARKEL
ncbi:MAG: hypothetical protein IJZ35_09020 [Clostridia bacterium]|nr:hypothetical protein [Clostridia bacterium]